VSTNEKRAYPRIDIREKLKFGQDSPIHDGYSRNFSPDGMSIVSEKGLPPNSNIKIKIGRATGDPIGIEGKVIWVSNPPGVNTLMGIKFTNFSDELLRLYKARSRYK
jgi:hypothetical protein